ncbi:divalent-cation tolerance protein CutA [Streptomyces hesseae]|uniref:Divalent-cation tolerance protein CutA n=1 Tax=Streptomyces hesseae TaxID=3075519 RepID=A0ABU2SP90_9ACTN|nr:divalent-cation tolerance protein CutA [Streptomyces sp. DSM 40473]MDT0450808.1 divalent-cation tolerance protein CutA [Streptomyces sp. DSM 40473]
MPQQPPHDDRCLMVITTTDSERAARALVASVVGHRLAACAQIDGPVTSVYHWKGAIESTAEWRVVLKTTAARYPELEARIKAEHSYDVPEIIATEITAGGADYLAWLRAETAP